MALIETGPDNVVVIKVIGVGGAGNNAVDRMIDEGTQNIDFIAVNTDKPALGKCKAPEKLQIGAKLTRGQGAGSDPDVGKRAAEENRNEISKLLEHTDMLFIACGMGGGTGTGAAPIIAEIAKEMGILTVGVVTKPFKFEGKRRMNQAIDGIVNLFDKVDSLFVIPNERIKSVAEERITMVNGFRFADEVLYQSITSISDLVKRTDVLNLDFADVKSIMKGSGLSHMGVGRASGKTRSEDAVKDAIVSQLMDTSIEGAHAVLINFRGSKEMSLEEVYAAAEMVEEMAHEDANIIFGVGLDESMDDEIMITIVATHFDDAPGLDELTKVVDSRTPLTYLPQSIVIPEPEPEPVVQAPPAAAQQRYAPEPEEPDPFDIIFDMFNKKN